MSSGRGAHLSRNYEAVADTVPVARAELAAFAAGAGASEEQIQAVKLAVSEALTNAVLHAYRHAPGQIHINAAVASGELWVLIGDDGGGLHSGSESKGLGVGLALIAESTDGFAVVNRSSGGTEVRMRFSLQPAELPHPNQPRGSSASASRPASSFFSTTT